MSNYQGWLKLNPSDTFLLQKVIPNPKSERVLEPGDKLLCFGKLESMRGMIPARTQRKRRPKVKELPDTAVTNPEFAEHD